MAINFLNDGNFPCDDIYYGSWCVGVGNYSSGSIGEFTLTDDCKFTLEYPSIYLKDGLHLI